MNEQLKKRLQSFAWRAGMMLIAISLQFAIENASELNISPLATVLLGLVLGEVSKYLNAKK